MRIYNHPFRLSNHLNKERRLLNAEAPKVNPIVSSGETAKTPEQIAQDRGVINGMREKLAGVIKKSPSGAEVLVILRESLTDDGQITADEVRDLSNSIYRKFHKEVTPDVQNRLDDVLPKTSSDMIQLLIAKAELMSIEEYGQIVASVSVKSVRETNSSAAGLTYDQVQQLGNIPKARGLVRSRYLSESKSPPGRMVFLARESMSAPWGVSAVKTINEYRSQAVPRRRSFRAPSRGERPIDVIARYRRLGGGYPSASEIAFNRHIESARRSGAYVRRTGANSVYIDRTGKDRAYYAMTGRSREPIDGYDVNDPHRDAYTGYRTGKGAYSRTMNSYYDRMGGPAYIRSQAKLRGKYTERLEGNYSSMVKEFKGYGEKFRNHPRFGSSYKKWEGMLNRYGGRFPDQYAYLTEFRTQIQAYRKASEVEGHMSESRDAIETSGIKGEKYIAIPVGPAARWRSLTVSVSKTNPDGTVSKFTYHPGVVEQFDASRDLEGMIGMGVDIQRKYSLMGDRDGKKKLRGLNLRFANEGMYSVNVVSDGYRQHYEVPVGKQAGVDSAKEKKSVKKDALAVAPVELIDEAGVIHITKLGDREHKSFTVGSMSVGQERHGGYGIMIRKVNPTTFGKHKYEIYFSQTGTYQVNGFYVRRGNSAFNTKYEVKPKGEASTEETCPAHH